VSILPLSDGLGGETVSTESLRASGSTDVVSPPKRNLKTAALDEAKSFVGIFIYLFIVFGLLSLHAWVVLSAENISYRFYGMALINARVVKDFLPKDLGLPTNSRTSRLSTRSPTRR